MCTHTQSHTHTHITSTHTLHVQTNFKIKDYHQQSHFTLYLILIRCLGHPYGHISGPNVDVDPMVMAHGPCAPVTGRYPLDAHTSLVRESQLTDVTLRCRGYENVATAVAHPQSQLLHCSSVWGKGNLSAQGELPWELVCVMELTFACTKKKSKTEMTATASNSSMFTPFHVLYIICFSVCPFVVLLKARYAGHCFVLSTLKSVHF